MLSFALANFDLAYVEKEGKRPHVIRLSHPGFDTYLFSADTKESAERWIEVRLGVDLRGGGEAGVTLPTPILTER